MPRTKQKKERKEIKKIAQAVVNAKKKQPRRARRPRIRGRGGYFSDAIEGAGLGVRTLDFLHPNAGFARRAITALSSGASKAFLGSMVPGYVLAQHLSRLVGAGPYVSMTSPASNTMLASVSSGNVPEMHSTTESIRICKSEYLGKLLSATGDSPVLSKIDVNPGLSSFSPWLATIARNFESYRFHGLAIVLKSVMTQSMSTFSSLGFSAMASSVNVGAPAPSSLAELMSMKFAVTAKTSENIIGYMECADKGGLVNKNYLVRAGPVPDELSKADCDQGEMYIGSYGCPSADVLIGELWVTYDVELLNPRITSIPYSGADYADYDIVGGTSSAAFGAAGPPTVVHDDLSLSFRETTPAAGYNQIVFPAGNRDMFIFIQHALKTAAAAASSALNLTAYNCSLSSTDGTFMVQQTDGDYTVTYNDVAKIPAPGSTNSSRAILIRVSPTTTNASFSIKFTSCTPPGTCDGKVIVFPMGYTAVSSSMRLTAPTSAFDDESKSEYEVTPSLPPAPAGPASAGAASVKRRP